MLFYPLLAIGIFGVYWSVRNKAIIPSILSGGMLVAIILFSQGKDIFIPIAAYFYILMSVLALLYGASKKKVNLLECIVLILIPLLMAAYWLWVMNHWHGNTLLAPFLTCILAFLALILRLKLRNEMGYLLILVADAILILFDNLMFQ